MQFSGKRARVVAPLLLLAMGAAACGGSSSGGTGSTSTNAAGTPAAQDTANAVSGGTLNVLGSGDVDYMDPNLSYYSVGYMAHRLWSRQLFTYPADQANNTKAQPDLAQQIPTAQNGGISPDGLKYTIKIKDGAKWDTTPARQITAEDFIRGVKRTCNPVQPFGGLPDYQDLIAGFQTFCTGFAKAGQSASAIAGYQNSHQISGLRAVDPTTVEFTLTHPATYFVDLLTLTAFSPAPKEYDQYVPGTATSLGQHTVSDGPYKIETYEPTKRIVFVRNPAWDKATDTIRKAYVDRVVIDETASQESTQQQLQTGAATADMEFDNFPPPAAIPGLVAKKDPNLNLGFTASSNPYVIYNILSPNNNGALAKPEVRQAINFAINRANILQALGGPTTNPPITHVLPDSITGGTPNFDPYPYDANKAKQMLAAAGFPNGFTVKFLYRNASQGSSKAFATIQQDLTKAGIKVVGVPVPNADFYTKYLQVPDVAKRGVWDLSLAGWGADWYGNAALSFFNPLFSGKPSFPPTGSNYGYYDSPATNALIKQAVAAKSEQEAGALWHQADEQVMKDAPFYPITNPKQPNYHAAQVHNAQYVPQIQNFDMANVWLDPAKNGG